jgi:putative spermidine/putrescine transport system permease protein
MPPGAAARRNAREFAGVAPALALVTLVFVFPVAALLLRSVLEPQPGLQNYAEIFASSTYLRIFENTFLVAALVTLATLGLGFPVAWLMAIASPFWSGLLFAIVVLSMWTNLLTRTTPGWCCCRTPA